MTFFRLNLLDDQDPFRIYENIAKNKRDFKDILYGADQEKSNTYTRVQQCYSNYLSKLTSIETITAFEDFSTDEKAALLHCYTGNTKNLKNLKRDIINKQNTFYQSKCAYCGLNENKYMDHYLPKDNFPEYSVLSYNLVPACSYCNEKKGEKFLSYEGDREIFNPYFDECSNEILLTCIITCTEDNLTFSLKVTELAENKPIFKNHIKNTDLITRYEDQLSNKISTRVNDILIELEEHQDTQYRAQRVMERKLNKIIETRGINSLEAIALRAILANETLFNIDYLKKIKNKKIIQESQV